MPPGVTVIGSGAFQGCNGFTGNLILPASVTSIESQAFSVCSSFTVDLVILSNVISIGNSAFFCCEHLFPVYCKALVPPTIPFNGTCFSNTSQLYIPLNRTEIYSSKDGWKEFGSIQELRF